MNFFFVFEWFSYFMNTVYRWFYQSGILTKHGYFLLLKRKFSYDPATKPSNVSIFVKPFLKFRSFQETRANSKVSSETKRADRIILNIFGVTI